VAAGTEGGSGACPGLRGGTSARVTRGGRSRHMRVGAVVMGGWGCGVCLPERGQAAGGPLLRSAAVYCHPRIHNAARSARRLLCPFPLRRLPWRTANKTESLPSRRAVARGHGGRNRTFALGHSHFAAEGPEPLGCVTWLSPPTHMQMLKDRLIPKRGSLQVKTASRGTLSSLQEGVFLGEPHVRTSVTRGRVIRATKTISERKTQLVW